MVVTAEHGHKPADEFERLFSDDPACLRRSLEIAEQCTFSLDDLRYRYPEEQLPSGHSEQGWLRELTFRGARARYRGKVPADVRTQLERELKIIRKLDYGGYFLTMHEIIQYCREENILCQGRGSAANSAVCFCLGITAIVVPISVKMQTIRLEYPVMVVVAGIVLLLCRDLLVDRIEGGFLFLALVLFTVFVVFLSRREVASDEANSLEWEVQRTAGLKSGTGRAWGAHGFWPRRGRPAPEGRLRASRPAPTD